MNKNSLEGTLDAADVNIREIASKQESTLMSVQLKGDERDKIKEKQYAALDTYGPDSDEPGNTLKASLNVATNQKKKKGQLIEKPPPKKVRRTKFTLIVKPDCFSQGKGIFLTNNFNDLKGLPKEEGDHVIQEYMKEPHLIDELKYDIRLYVLVLSCEPLKIFLFKDGIVRFATKKYQVIENTSGKKDLDNLFMHLTNYAVNKEGDDFKMPKNINDDSAHKRTLAKVLERLKLEG